MQNYKAIVYIHGACSQILYGRKPEPLMARAVAALTYWEPGFAGLYPERVDLLQNAGQISGNRSNWTPVRTLQFSEIPAEQHAWKIRKAAKA
jgi:hypothetical protein